MTYLDKIFWLLILYSALYEKVLPNQTNSLLA